jgi:hypothetical protein
MSIIFPSQKEIEESEKFSFLKRKNDMKEAKKKLYGVTKHNLSNQNSFKGYNKETTPYNIFDFNLSVKHVLMENNGVNNGIVLSLYKFGDDFYVLGNEPIDYQENNCLSREDLIDSYINVFNSLKFFHNLETVEKYIKNHFNINLMKEQKEEEKFEMEKEFFPPLYK